MLEMVCRSCVPWWISWPRVSSQLCGSWGSWCRKLSSRKYDSGCSVCRTPSGPGSLLLYLPGRLHTRVQYLEHSIPEYSNTRYQSTIPGTLNSRVQYLEQSIPEYHTWNTQCQSKLPGSLNTKVQYLEHSIPKYSNWNTQYQSTVPGTLDTGV